MEFSLQLYELLICSPEQVLLVILIIKLLVQGKIEKDSLRHLVHLLVEEGQDVQKMADRAYTLQVKKAILKKVDEKGKINGEEVEKEPDADNSTK